MAFIFSALAGFFAVVQAGINKIIAEEWGFSSALLLNGLVFLVFNLILFAGVWLQPKLFPEDYLLQGRFTDFKMWWLIPGLCGFLLVTGLAVSLTKIGALQAFVICIASQVLCGLAWDAMVEGKALTTARVVGALITVSGAFVASR